MAEETKEETKKQNVVIPEAKDRMTREEADKIIALVKLDRAKLVTQRAKFKMSLAQCDAAIADQDQVLADIERRVANVDYPEVPKAENPTMGEPVGGTKEGK